MRATLALNWLNRNPVDRNKGRANNANEVTQKLTTYNANVFTTGRKYSKTIKTTNRIGLFFKIVANSSCSIKTKIFTSFWSPL